jgi:hypothetical protein
MNFKDIAKALLPKCFARRSATPHYLYTRAGVKYDYTGCLVGAEPCRPTNFALVRPCLSRPRLAKASRAALVGSPKIVGGEW